MTEPLRFGNGQVRATAADTHPIGGTRRSRNTREIRDD